MLDWLKRLFRREKPRIFLGQLAVVPRSDFKRHIEGISWAKGFAWFGLADMEDLDAEMQASLADLFDMPPVTSRNPPEDSDLALDVAIKKFQAGEFLPIKAGPVIIPLLWRAKITVAARLYHIDTGETRAAHVLTRKLGWPAYLKRISSPEGVLPEMRSDPLFTSRDTKRVLYKACIGILEKLRKDV